MSYRGFSDFIGQINDTPWKGMIHESSISSIVSYIFSLYSKDKSCIVFSSYSDSENSKASAIRNLYNLIEKQENISTDSPRFYLSVVGKFNDPKSGKISDGWVAFKTFIPSDSGIEESETILHFHAIKKIHHDPIDKPHLSGLVYDLVEWLMRALLIGEYKSWEDAFEKRINRQFIFIDILEDHRLSDSQHLRLASADGPLAYVSIDDKMQYIEIYKALELTDKFASNNVPLEYLGEENMRVMDISEVDGPLTESTIVMSHRESIPLKLLLLRRYKESVEFTMTAEDFNSMFLIENSGININDPLYSNLKEEDRTKMFDAIIESFLRPVMNESIKLTVIDPNGIMVQNELTKDLKVNVLK